VAAEGKPGSSEYLTKTFPPTCKPWSASWSFAPSWDVPRRSLRGIPPKALKTRGAAAYLGVSMWTLRNFVHDGLLEYLPGKHWRFSTDDLDEYIRRNREKEPAL
jgi:excisionase family DNA binding protein